MTRVLHLPATLLLLAAACRGTAPALGAPPPAPPAVAAPVEAVVRDSLFGAVARFDYAAMRRAVTPGFELVEDSARMSIAQFEELVRGFERSATIRYRFEGFNTRVAGGVAWTTYRLQGDATFPDRAITFTWLETAVLVRTGDGWRIDRLHSTLLGPRS